jgi:hypothetical protein
MLEHPCLGNGGLHTLQPLIRKASHRQRARQLAPAEDAWIDPGVPDPGL